MHDQKRQNDNSFIGCGLYRSHDPSLIGENGHYVAHFHRSCDRYTPLSNKYVFTKLVNHLFKKCISIKCLHNKKWMVKKVRTSYSFMLSDKYFSCTFGLSVHFYEVHWSWKMKPTRKIEAWFIIPLRKLLDKYLVGDLELILNKLTFQSSILQKKK
jgi:hypothetical protein